MNHARARDLIADYLEGDLDVPTRASLDRHLEGCPSCSEEVRSLRGVVGLLQGLPDPQPGIDLADVVMDQISAGKARPRLQLQRRVLRGVTVPQWVGAMAAGLAGLAVTFAISGGQEPPRQLALARPETSRPTPSQAIVGGPGDATRRSSLANTTPGSRLPDRAIPSRVVPSRVVPKRSFRLVPAAQIRPPVSTFRSVRGMPDRGAAFAASVAPLPDVLERSDSPEREVDRQIEWLRRDPLSFLRRTSRMGNQHFVRLARRAASLGEADALAGQLMSIQTPEANQLQMRLMLESLSADMSQR